MFYSLIFLPWNTTLLYLIKNYLFYNPTSTRRCKQTTISSVLQNSWKKNLRKSNLKWNSLRKRNFKEKLQNNNVFWPVVIIRGRSYSFVQSFLMLWNTCCNVPLFVSTSITITDITFLFLMANCSCEGI